MGTPNSVSFGVQLYCAYPQYYVTMTHTSVYVLYQTIQLACHLSEDNTVRKRGDQRQCFYCIFSHSKEIKLDAVEHQDPCRSCLALPP